MENFNEIYEFYNKKIYKYLLYICKDEILAEELLQETFFQAFKGINKFRGDSSINTWLMAIAKNCYYQNLRKNNKGGRATLEELDGLSDLSTPENIYEEKIGTLNIYESIDRLQEPYRQVMILRVIEEMSFKEIGEKLMKNETWARVTFHRGKAKLGKEIGNSEK